MRPWLIPIVSFSFWGCSAPKAPDAAPPAAAKPATPVKKEAPLPELAGYPLRNLAPSARRPFANIAQEELCGCDNPRTLAGCLSKPEPCTQALVLAGVVKRMLELGLSRSQAQLSFSNLITDGMCADEVPLLKLEAYPYKTNTPQGQPVVEVIEFADFTCGHCAQAVQEFRPLMSSNLPIRFHFVPVQLGSNPLGAKVGVAALAAWRQGAQQFWRFHDMIFQNQDKLSEATLTSMARDAGLRMEQWQKDRKDPALEASLKNAKSLANQAGIKGTPYVLINGRPLNSSVNAVDLAARVQLEMLRHRKECEE